MTGMRKVGSISMGVVCSYTCFAHHLARFQLRLKEGARVFSKRCHTTISEKFSPLLPCILFFLLFISSCDTKANNYYDFYGDKLVLPSDSWMLYQIVKHYEDIKYDVPLTRNNNYSNNFIRIYDKDYSEEAFIEGLKSVNISDKKEYDEEVMLYSIYCDKMDYKRSDFAKTLSFYNGDSMYKDTHIFLSIILVLKNDCLHDGDKAIAIATMNDRAKRFALANEKYLNSSDLYNEDANIDIVAERITFMYWAGMSKYIDPKWLDKIMEFKQDDFGWRYSAYDYIDFHDNFGVGTNVPGTYYKISNPHTTGFVMVAVAYNNTGCDKRDCFPWNDSYLKIENR